MMTVRTDERNLTRDENWLEDAVVAIGLLIAATTLSLFIAWAFEELLAYNTINMILDADPLTRRFIFAESLRDRVFLKHPNLGNFINPPIRVIASLIGGEDPAAVRAQLALWVSPIAAGIKTAAIFVLLRLLRFSLIESAVVAILSAVTFSHMVHGSMPESFGLTSTWLVLLLVVSVGTLRCREPSRRQRRIFAGLFVLLGTVGIGITLTNLIPFAIVVLCVERFRTPRLGRALLRTMGACALAGILNLVLLAIFVGPGFDMQRQKEMGNGIRGHFHENPVARALQFPAAVSNEFAPPAPVFVEDPNSRMVPFNFTLEHPDGKRVAHPVVPLVVWCVLIAGTYGCLRRGSPQLRTLSIAALLIVGFNAAFHSFWGSQIILYALHWEASLILLLAGTFLLSTKLRRWFALVLMLGAIVLVFHNIGIMKGMLQTWDLEGPDISVLEKATVV